MPPKSHGVWPHRASAFSHRRGPLGGEGCQGSVVARIGLLFDPSRTSLPCNVWARKLARLIVQQKNNPFRRELSSQQSRRKWFFTLKAPVAAGASFIGFSGPLGFAPSLGSSEANGPRPYIPQTSKEL